jgi:phosphoribosylamine---glycine ligase
MKVLITGSGAREHALAVACSCSDGVERVYVAPGNGGTAAAATNVSVAADDVQGLVRFASEEGVGLVVLGPEASVAAGAGDALRAVGIPCFGPDREPGRLETSKAFAKRLMRDAGIPTAAFGVFDAPDPARAFARERDGRVVVKADGLAQGKGVLVCGSVEEAERAIDQVLVDRAFGEAGDQLVVEERLQGPELSVLAVTDGREVVPLAPARDYKRALDGDRGLNTGGMGAYSPPLGVDQRVLDDVAERVLHPTVRALAERGLDYRGVLYAGLMLTAEGPRVLEFNCRFGDPEAQVVLPRLRGDLVALMLAAAEGRLASRPALEWDPRPAVGIVVASGGYPADYRTGFPIRGLDRLPEGVSVFHAGTRRAEGTTVTAGGRVLTVVALGERVAEARAGALAGAARVGFPGAFHRSDIAKEAEGNT